MREVGVVEFLVQQERLIDRGELNRRRANIRKNVVCKYTQHVYIYAYIHRVYMYFHH